MPEDHSAHGGHSGSRRSLRLDARRSPAQLLDRRLLDASPSYTLGQARAEPPAQEFDRALRWLTLGDQIISGELGRALLEVRRRKLHEKEGHVRFGTYVRAFVGRTHRWTQYEMRRERDLAGLPRWARGGPRGAALGGRARRP